jgi:glycosyltransferase involved in cell wall biosynthesis
MDAAAGLRILAFESWDGGSHAAVRRSIDLWSRHAWTWVTLPARGWRWRMRTGAWTLAERAAEHAADAAAGGFDAIVTGGLVSLPDLLAALRRPPWPRRSAGWPPPAMLLMHENQAAYPAGPGGEDERDAHLVLTNLASIAAADAVLWNSAWNRRSLAEGVRSMRLRRLDPDPPAAMDPAVLERIGQVCWLPVEDAADPGARTRPDPGPGPNEPVRVVWPHRWEHDKGPEELLELARDARRRAAAGEGPRLRWVLLGERFRRVPAALETFRREFAADIDHDGHLEPDAYRRQLASSDWVLSTARHEFFGIAVVEAMLAGCLPWLPPRLSYPELLPPEARGLSPHTPPDDPAAVRAAIRRHLEPAIAPRAVAAIDAAVSEMVAAAAGGGSAGPEPPVPNPGSKVL